jgi:hypothetical protein
MCSRHLGTSRLTLASSAVYREAQMEDYAGPIPAGPRVAVGPG